MKAMNSQRFQKKGAWLVIAVALGLTGPAYGQTGAAKAAAAPARVNVQADMDALIKAAKAEGEVAIYSAAPESGNKRTFDAFATKYGIKVLQTRLSSTALQQRYATEAEAGTIAVDLTFFAGGVVAFANDGIKKGWVESISQAGIPALKSGEYPVKFNKGPTAIIQIAPWGLPYNTDKVKGADVPKDWTVLVDPKWKTQILLTNPTASDAFLDFWAIMLDKYGPNFFAQLRAQNARVISDGIQATQALAAGEGAFQPPAVPAQVQGPKDRGAPLMMVIPDYTTGVEMQVMLTARNRAKHPNAARLMANYVMSEEGNKVFNDDPGGVHLYDTSRLPKDYQPTRPENATRRAEFMKLLGIQ